MTTMMLPRGIQQQVLLPLVQLSRVRPSWMMDTAWVMERIGLTQMVQGLSKHIVI